MLVSYRSSVLYPPDALSLFPGRWIGDAAIGFFFDHLAASAPPTVLLLSPSAALIPLMEADPADVKEGLCLLPLSTAELVLIPVIDGSVDVTAAASGTHWSLLRWRRGAGFSHVNSAGSGGGSNLESARLIAARLLPLLGGDSGGGVVVAEVPSVVAQRGSCDCGAHVMQNAEAAVAEFLGGGGGGGGSGDAGGGTAAPLPPLASYRSRVWQLAASMPFDAAAAAWFSQRPFPA